MDKNFIENYIICNNIDLSSLSSMQLITIIMEQVETVKGLKGDDKKLLLLNCYMILLIQMMQIIFLLNVIIKIY
jgi:hypothetical protein